MDQITQSWVDAAKHAVMALQRKYSINQGLLLTEGDLHCFLFNELMQYGGLSNISKTKSGYNDGTQVDGRKLSSGYVHSEVTWFRKNQTSGFEVDIMLLDPQYLEVENFELFENMGAEKYPHKCYAYDGPCVAIELKFLRFKEKKNSKSVYFATEDLIKLRDEVIPDKIVNINENNYKYATVDNIAFISIVCCKDYFKFKDAINYIGEELSNGGCQENLFIWLFYQGEIIWDKEEFIRLYKLNKSS